MKVFGCWAFASNPKLDTNNFKARGIRCAFLGHLTTHKSHKRLDIATQHTSVSRYVRFAEHIFSFHKDNFNAYIQPPPPIIS